MRLIKIVLLLLVLGCSSSFPIEKSPEYPGGKQKLFEFLANNIKYPEEAKDLGIKGRVFAQFLVEKDGSLSNIEILRGIGYGCDKEVIRVIKLMPNWSPGMQKGKKVRVRFTLPVNFKLK